MGAIGTFGLSDALADAALRCIARWGLTKTTLEDVAREAGLSRATVYRALPGGGKEGLFSALATRELLRLEAAVGAAVDATESVEDALVAAATTVAGHLEGHAAFQFLLAHEPGLVLPHLAFHQLDVLLARVRTVGGPLLERFLPARESAELAEWLARFVISSTCSPSPGVRLTEDADVRRIVRSYVLPGIAVPA